MLIPPFRVAWTIPSSTTCSRGDWRLSRALTYARLSPFGSVSTGAYNLLKSDTTIELHARTVASIYYSLPSVLPSLPVYTEEGSTDMSQLHFSRDYSRATQCYLRFEPSSRTTLIGEQPNPWDLMYFPPLLEA